MLRKTKYRQGERVNGISLAGKKVIGVYRGQRPSFGVYIYGLEEGCTEPALHVCLALTLTRPPPVKLTKKGKPKGLKAGDHCTSITPQGIQIYGRYMNADANGKSWIRGWHDGANRLTDPPQAWKVLTSHLKPC